MTSTADDPANQDEEYQKIIFVPPTELKIGPNVRTENAEPDPDQVRSFKKHGVQAPIRAYRDEAGDLVVTRGQVRTLGAIEAGLETVPVWLQPPPVGDEKAATIDRIRDQLDENDLRKPMARGDRYRAHRQVALFGLSPTAIARRLGRSKRVIEDSLRVGESELAAKAADEYDLTLDQAAVIAEFEDYGDIETAKQLIITAVEHPNNFATCAQRKRDERAEAERVEQARAACTEQLTAAGVLILDDSIPDWTGDARSLDRLRPTPTHAPGTELTAEDHACCPGHAAWIDHEFDDDGEKIVFPRYGCADFEAHGHAAIGAPEGAVGHGDSTPQDPAADHASAVVAADVERRKASIKRKWVINNNRDADAARKGRQQWLAAFARRTSVPKGARRWLALQTLNGLMAVRRAMERGHPLAHSLLGLPEPMPWYHAGTEGSGELYDRIANASDNKATIYELYLILVALEDGFRRDSWRDPTTTDKLYITMAIDLGYEAPDIDLKVLDPDNLDEIIAAQLAEDAEDAAVGSSGDAAAMTPAEGPDGANLAA
jgi:ParB family chromosome partitioning protein